MNDGESWHVVEFLCVLGYLRVLSPQAQYVA